MKKRLLPLMLLPLMVLFSCSEDDEEQVSIDENTIQEVMAVENTIAEVQDLADISSVPGGRVKEVCAEVSYDQATRIMEMDFGTGCTGPAGVERSGKIMVEFNGSDSEWFKHIVNVANRFGVKLKLSSKTKWSGIPEKEKSKILKKVAT